MPGQERGRRPSRALPYEPAVSAMLDAGGRLRVRLRNRGASPAHFALYPYAGVVGLPEHVDVERDHAEQLVVVGEAYRLAVQGPNRLWYELAGTRSGAAGRVDVRPGTVPYRRVLSLELENAGESRVTLRVAALGYGDGKETVRLRPGQTRTTTWDTDQGWYDLEVTAEEDPAFRRRLTGRLENGRPGITA
jgi:phospholipase C